MTDEKETSKPDRKKKPLVSLAEIPTQTGIVFVVEDKQMGLEEYLVWLGNEVTEIKKTL